MKLMIFAAAAAALAATPALADPGKRGGPGKHHAMKAERGCPPGLAKKHNGCMPPGQAKKYGWSRGYYVPSGYSGWTRYQSLPRYYRQRHAYDPGNYYVYRDGSVYAVDRTTRLIESIIRILR
ncbi:hypothetical protein [Sphingomonas sp.]|uniref:hypothetical protein n=1 Tax=Sphingomonas sp. TaxID=28214 RepID=UPI001ECD004A|nr:hypothetical protein [Sphingomonas sp.]MBX3593104.1 hypothetical protein [Sphingomonas sp.]